MLKQGFEIVFLLLRAAVEQWSAPDIQSFAAVE